LRNLRRMAQYIRHLPGLERAEWLWAAARGPYHRVLGAGGHGVEVKVGGTAAVRMPPAFSGGAWETFEPEAVAALADWVRRHPGGLVLDIGSSIGIFSAIALSAGDDVEVVAFDPDLASLAAVRQLCAHAEGERLRLVHGFVTQAASETASLEEAAARTQAALIRTGIRGEVGTTRYASLTDAVPRWRLDDLCAGAGRPPDAGQVRRRGGRAARARRRRGAAAARASGPPPERPPARFARLWTFQGRGGGVPPSARV
jgi:FkbM family methyltransferase